MDVLVGLGDGPVGKRERNTQPGRQVAGDTRHRHGVGTVRVDLEVVQHIARQAQLIHERATQLEALGQDHDAVVVVAETDLRSAAAHPVGVLAPHLALGDLHPVRHHRADRGERDVVADRHVERPAADLQGLTRAGVDVDELDAIGLGVGAQIEHLRDHDPRQGVENRHLLDRRTQVAQVVADLDGVALDGGELAEPGQ